jgi:ubiquinone/menaquinone biosynthesis C-methylase UbiE
MTLQHGRWQDEGRARRYAKQSGLVSRLVYAPFAQKVVAHLSPSQSQPTIVDLGCGPGYLTVELGRLRPQARIVCIDPSSEMLQLARQNVAKAGLANCEASVGNAEQIPLESESADLIVSQSSFHEWADRRKGLLEIRRVLKPGGSLILKDYNLAWLSDWKRRLLGAFHHLGMFKFDADQVVALLKQAGFQDVEVVSKGVQYTLHARKA